MQFDFNLQSQEASKLQPINKDKERMHEAHEKAQELNESFSKEAERKLTEKMEVIQENKNAQMMAKQERLKEHVCFYFASSRGVDYCDKHVCLSVCLSVCLHAYHRNQMSKLYPIFCACCLWSSESWSFFSSIAVHYVLLVLLMTSCFPMMNP